MTLSFHYPPNLLHSLVEPQWFRRPKDETESSLDRLERDEEIFLDVTRRIVLPIAPEPIGIAGCTDEVKQQNPTPAPFDDALLLPPPPQETFWMKYKDQLDKYMQVTGFDTGNNVDFSHSAYTVDTDTNILDEDSNMINDSCLNPDDDDSELILHQDAEDVNMEMQKNSSSEFHLSSIQQLLKYQRPSFSPITSIRQLDQSPAILGTTRTRIPTPTAVPALINNNNTYVELSRSGARWSSTVDPNHPEWSNTKTMSPALNSDNPYVGEHIGNVSRWNSILDTNHPEQSHARSFSRRSRLSSSSLSFGLDSPTGRTG